MQEELIWHYLIQMSQGLQYLHERRILHRDIKPQNIMLDAHNNVKIGDLGFGRLLATGEHHVRSGVGTPLYFSPELCQEKPYNEKTDMWALGCLVYELAAQRTPFTAANQLALATKIVQSEPEPVPQQYSVELQFLINRLLEKDQDVRPSARQVLSYPAVVVRAELARALQAEKALTDQLAQTKLLVDESQVFYSTDEIFNLLIVCVLEADGAAPRPIRGRYGPDSRRAGQTRRAPTSAVGRH